MSHTPPRVLAREGLDALIRALADDGYRVIGPTVREAAIVHDDLASTGDLPEGWTDEQEAGTYRLRRRDDAALFGFNSPAMSWKRFLHPPQQTLLRVSRDPERGLRFEPAAPPAERMAFVGVRACDLAAIRVLDRVLQDGTWRDPRYATRREGVLVVSVTCAEAGATCFCASMGTGPRPGEGFDLSLTEILDGEHRFVVEVGSEAGRSILERLSSREASEEEVAAIDRAARQAEAQMGRHVETEGIRELLQDHPEHPRWDDVAARCLTCANCTMVCPTCFCSSVEDHTDLAGGATREQRWESCFTLRHSQLHGGPARRSTKARYRQWLTHKVSTWHDQFGSSGCVGCGRCITWCPVGIDITEEIAAIRAAEGES
ncbi:MAG: 4Fe-4S dicluster domain-containing protein [Myxococcota bacterium]